MNDALIQPIQETLLQLSLVLENLNDEQYTEQIALLSGASIGQHTRHIIEFFQELERGYVSGCVYYDGRKRDHATETHRHHAISQLQAIAIQTNKTDKPLQLLVNFTGTDEQLYVPTNYERELVYNLEHTVHHTALLRIAINLVSSLRLPEDFGVAVSTIQYRKVCAQ